MNHCITCTCNFIFPLIGCSYSKVYTVKGQNLTTGKLKIIMLSFKSYSIQTFKFCSIFYWEYHRNKMLCLFGSKDNLFVFAWTNADQTPYWTSVQWWSQIMSHLFFYWRVCLVDCIFLSSHTKLNLLKLALKEDNFINDLSSWNFFGCIMS